MKRIVTVGGATLALVGTGLAVSAEEVSQVSYEEAVNAYTDHLSEVEELATEMQGEVAQVVYEGVASEDYSDYSDYKEYLDELNSANKEEHDAYLAEVAEIDEIVAYNEATTVQNELEVKRVDAINAEIMAENEAHIKEISEKNEASAKVVAAALEANAAITARNEAEQKRVNEANAKIDEANVAEIARAAELNASQLAVIASLQVENSQIQATNEAELERVSRLNEQISLKNELEIARVAAENERRLKAVADALEANVAITARNEAEQKRVASENAEIDAENTAELARVASLNSAKLATIESILLENAQIQSENEAELALVAELNEEINKENAAEIARVAAENEALVKQIEVALTTNSAIIARNKAEQERILAANAKIDEENAAEVARVTRINATRLEEIKTISDENSKIKAENEAEQKRVDEVNAKIAVENAREEERVKSENERLTKQYEEEKEAYNKALVAEEQRKKEIEAKNAAEQERVKKLNQEGRAKAETETEANKKRVDDEYALALEQYQKDLEEWEKSGQLSADEMEAYQEALAQYEEAKGNFDALVTIAKNRIATNPVEDASIVKSTSSSVIQSNLKEISVTNATTTDLLEVVTDDFYNAMRRDKVTSIAVADGEFSINASYSNSVFGQSGLSWHLRGSEYYTGSLALHTNYSIVFTIQGVRYNVITDNPEQFIAELDTSDLKVDSISVDLYSASSVRSGTFYEQGIKKESFDRITNGSAYLLNAVTASDGQVLSVIGASLYDGSIYEFDPVKLKSVTRLDEAIVGQLATGSSRSTGRATWIRRNYTFETKTVTNENGFSNSALDGQAGYYLNSTFGTIADLVPNLEVSPTEDLVSFLNARRLSSQKVYTNFEKIVGFSTINYAVELPNYDISIGIEKPIEPTGEPDSATKPVEPVRSSYQTVVWTDIEPDLETYTPESIPEPIAPNLLTANLKDEETAELKELKEVPVYEEEQPDLRQHLVAVLEELVDVPELILKEPKLQDLIQANLKELKDVPGYIEEQASLREHLVAVLESLVEVPELELLTPKLEDLVEATLLELKTIPDFEEVLPVLAEHLVAIFEELIEVPELLILTPELKPLLEPVLVDLKEVPTLTKRRVLRGTPPTEVIKVPVTFVTTKQTAPAATTATGTEKTSATSSKQTLPNTGEAFSLLGLLGTGLTAVGLVGRRKRR